MCVKFFSKIFLKKGVLKKHLEILCGKGFGSERARDRF